MRESIDFTIWEKSIKNIFVWGYPGASQWTTAVLSSALGPSLTLGFCSEKMCDQSAYSGSVTRSSE